MKLKNCNFLKLRSKCFKAAGTIEECVGYLAGPIMDMDNLGKTIVDMDLKRRGLLPKKKPLSEIAMRRNEVTTFCKNEFVRIKK